MPKVKKEAEKIEKTTKKAPKAAVKPVKKEVKKVAPKKAAEVAVKETPVKVSEVKETKKVVAEKPAKAAAKAKVSKEDTGSVDFQIDNFSSKIKSLAKHLKTHTHDFDSRRGLLIMVGKRRRLLNYLKKNDLVEYEKAVKTLKLKA